MAEASWVYSPSGIGYNWVFKPESYDEQFARNANQITATLVTKWDDAGDLKADLMESSEHVLGQKWLKRNPPLKCPETDAAFLTSMKKVALFMKKNDGSGYGTQDRDAETGWWKMDRIHYQCTFTNLPYKVKTDDEVNSLECPELNRYCKIQPQSITTNRTVPTKTAMVLDEGSSPPIYEPQVIPETLIRYMVTMYRWPKEAINWDTIFDRVNKVNDTDFVLYGITHPPESLAYEGITGQPEEEDGPDGKKYLNFTHSFLRHPVNWNKTLYPTAAAGVVDYKYFKLRGTDPPVRRFRKISIKEIFWPK